jgi:hypothetical protein
MKQHDPIEDRDHEAFSGAPPSAHPPLPQSENVGPSAEVEHVAPHRVPEGDPTQGQLSPPPKPEKQVGSERGGEERDITWFPSAPQTGVD